MVLSVTSIAPQFFYTDTSWTIVEQTHICKLFCTGLRSLSLNQWKFMLTFSFSSSTKFDANSCYTKWKKMLFTRAKNNAAIAVVYKTWNIIMRAFDWLQFYIGIIIISTANHFASSVESACFCLVWYQCVNILF